MIIDAENLIIGRLGTFVAKSALQGQTIDIINAEKAIFTGSKENIYKKYKNMVDKGTRPQKGPFISRREDFFLRRIIRGMLPYKQEKGLIAYKRIKCHIGTPEELKGKETTTVKEADIKNTRALKCIKLNELCKLLGKKQ